MIPVTWPFAVWGLDIVGPLQKAPGGYTHLLVAIDKFSKWVEVRTITNLRAEEAVSFFTDIVYRFGVPNSIITDNGSQLTPFFLVYGVEAVLPTDLEYGSPRVRGYDEGTN
jgi:hypothetical protein